METTDPRLRSLVLNQRRTALYDVRRRESITQRPMELDPGTIFALQTVRSNPPHPSSHEQDLPQSFSTICLVYKGRREGLPRQQIGRHFKRIEELFASTGCPATLRIDKIGKIGNFVLQNRRKIGNLLSNNILSTKIAFLHLIRVIIKATSPQLVRSQDLDQLSRLIRSENDQ